MIMNLYHRINTDNDVIQDTDSSLAIKVPSLAKTTKTRSVLTSSIKSTATQYLNNIYQYLSESIELFEDNVQSGQWISLLADSVEAHSILNDGGSIPRFTYDQMMSYKPNLDSNKEITLTGSAHNAKIHLDKSFVTYVDSEGHSHINAIGWFQIDDDSKVYMNFNSSSNKMYTFSLFSRSKSEAVNSLINVISDVQASNDLNIVLQTAITTCTGADWSVSTFKSAIQSKFKGLKDDALTAYQMLIDSFQAKDLTAVLDVVSNIFSSMSKLKVADDGYTIDFTDNSVYAMKSLGWGMISGIISAISQVVSSVVSAVSKIAGTIVSAVGAAINIVSKVFSSSVDKSTLTSVDFTADDRCLPMAVNQTTLNTSMGDTIVCRHSPFIDVYTWGSNGTVRSESFLGLNISEDCEADISWYCTRGFRSDLSFDSSQHSVENMEFNGEKLDYELLDYLSLDEHQDLLTAENTYGLSDDELDRKIRRRAQLSLLVYLYIMLPLGYSDQQTGDFKYYQYSTKTTNDSFIVTSFCDLYIAVISGGSNILSWERLQSIINNLNEAFADDYTSGMYKVYNTSWTLSCETMRRGLAGGFEFIKSEYDWFTLYTPHSKSACFCTWPKYDRGEIYMSLVLGAVIASLVVVSAATLYFTTRYTVKMARSKIQGDTESAWYTYTDNPTEENLKKYKRAVLKQNTVGKLFGCNKVDNTCYWNDTSDESTDKPDYISTPDFSDIKSYLGLKV